ncbi:MAG: hypothetical protein IPO10_18340 [Flavobacteriales bacterium]|nr:hypothetical protein [Flavobacteriales bacterium]
MSVDGNGDYDGVLEVFSSTGSCASLVSMGCTDGTFGGEWRPSSRSVWTLSDLLCAYIPLV